MCNLTSAGAGLIFFAATTPISVHSFLHLLWYQDFTIAH